jgi:H+/gluconate symporter-like permease
MTDPSGFLTTKLASMIGGLFGGATILTFIRPKTIAEAFTRGGMSAGSAVVFSSPLLRALDITSDWEWQIMAGFCIGFIAYSVLGMVANFLIKNEKKDIAEAIQDVRHQINDSNSKKKN